VWGFAVVIRRRVADSRSMGYHVLRIPSR